MSNDKRPIERALDLFVYVPLGLAAEARELLPRLAERGRELTGQNVTNAKVIGQMAVHQGRAEATRLRDEAIVRAGDAVERVRPSARSTESAPPAPPVPVDDSANGHRDRQEAAATAPDPGELAIPDYDSLSASQVVPRLAGLDEHELERVRTYEQAHRGRKTILGKVAQLQQKG